MFIQSQDLTDRTFVRQQLERVEPTADVWRHDSGALLIDENPFSDEDDDLTDEDRAWTWAGTAADCLRNVPAGGAL